MEGPRAIAGSEEPALIEFLNSHLRPKSPWSIADECPTTFTEKNRRNLHVICDDREVLSHAAVRYMILRTPQAVFKVAAIGSVVTSSDHRQKGLSRKILQNCLDMAKGEEADFAILWSDLFNFYRKLDFELAGSEISLLIDDELPVEKGDAVFREGANVSAEAVLRVYSRHTVGSVRTAEEIRRYLHIPNSRVYTAWDGNGLLQAYVVEGKGADLDGYIHEWGGGLSYLIPLLAHVRRQQNRPLTLIAPAHSENLIRRLGQLGVKTHEGYLGMIRLLNPEGVCDKITRSARAEGLADFAAKYAGGPFHLDVAGQSYEIADPKQFVQIIFGPHTSEAFQGKSAEAREIIARVLPMKLWFWGWDSI